MPLRMKTGRFFLIIAITIMAALSSPVFAANTTNDPSTYECVLSGSSKGSLAGCVSNPVGAIGTTSSAVTGNADANNITCVGNMCGARSNAKTNAVAPIDAWNECRWIDNTSTNDIFVPFRTSAEWNAFLVQVDGGKLPGVTETRCAVPVPTTTPFSVPANSDALLGSICNKPVPADYTMQAPYFARPGTHLVMPAYNFSCTVAGLCGNGTPSCGADKTWTQAATPTLAPAPNYVTGSKAQSPYDSNYPWDLTVAYVGTAPAPTHEPVNGVCGVGQYACSGLSDKEGSTQSGTPTNESNNGETFYWYCAGMNSGASSSQCSDTNGSCGSTQFSCATGQAGNTRDSGGTSSWQCTGINGGTTSSCSVCDSGYALVNGSCQPIINGSCGGSRFSCNAGTLTQASDSGSASNWVCAGANGGSNSPSCSVCDANYTWNGSACVLPVNGSCGGGSAWACNSGNATNGADNNGTYTWECAGAYGGSTSGQCSYTSGQCGSIYVPQSIVDNGYPALTAQQTQQAWSSAFFLYFEPGQTALFSGGGFLSDPYVIESGKFTFPTISPICNSGAASGVGLSNGYWAWSCGGVQCQLMPDLCVAGGYISQCGNGGSPSNFQNNSPPGGGWVSYNWTCSNSNHSQVCNYYENTGGGTN